MRTRSMAVPTTSVASFSGASSTTSSITSFVQSLRGRRGQLMMEFAFMVAFAILIGMIFLAVTVNLLSSVNDQQRMDDLNDVGYRIQDEVILAATVDDGYTRVFSPPKSAGRYRYTLVVDSTNESFSMTSGKISLVYDMPHVHEFIGCDDGTNHGFLPGKKHIITKNGTITVRCG